VGRPKICQTIQMADGRHIKKEALLLHNALVSIEKKLAIDE